MAAIGFGGWLKRIRANEPLRTTVYPSLVAIAATLVGTGTLDAGSVDLVTVILAAVLGIGSTEVARARVTPVVNKHYAE